jgi:hypothetical protein
MAVAPPPPPSRRPYLRIERGFTTRRPLTGLIGWAFAGPRRRRPHVTDVDQAAARVGFYLAARQTAVVHGLYRSTDLAAPAAAQPIINTRIDDDHPIGGGGDICQGDGRCLIVSDPDGTLLDPMVRARAMRIITDAAPGLCDFFGWRWHDNAQHPARWTPRALAARLVDALYVGDDDDDRRALFLDGLAEAVMLYKEAVRWPNRRVRVPVPGSNDVWAEYETAPGLTGELVLTRPTGETKMDERASLVVYGHALALTTRQGGNDVPFSELEANVVAYLHQRPMPRDRSNDRF